MKSESDSRMARVAAVETNDLGFCLFRDPCIILQRAIINSARSTPRNGNFTNPRSITSSLSHLNRCSGPVKMAAAVASSGPLISTLNSVMLLIQSSEGSGPFSAGICWCTNTRWRLKFCACMKFKSLLSVVYSCSILLRQ